MALVEYVEMARVEGLGEALNDGFLGIHEIFRWLMGQAPFYRL
jgi:hypothetical protein